MINRDEILLEQRNKKIRNITVVFFLLFSALFIHLAGGFDSNLFKLRQEIENVLELKFSTDDLLALGQGNALHRWINVQLIERREKVYVHPVKIKPVVEFSFDFKLDLSGTVYNLYRIGSRGKDIHDFFKTAGQWGLETSSPQLVRLKINNVLIGVYMMEKHIYEQIRDENGGYFLRLNSDILLLKKILYQVRTQGGEVMPGLISKYFDTPKLTSYLVFFSLFCYNEVLDFHRLAFRYDPAAKKFTPYLTMESVILSLQEQNKTFKIHPPEKARFFAGLNRENIENLLVRSRYYTYGKLVKAMLTQARYPPRQGIATVDKATL